MSLGIDFCNQLPTHLWSNPAQTIQQNTPSHRFKSIQKNQNIKLFALTFVKKSYANSIDIT